MQRKEITRLVGLQFKKVYKKVKDNLPAYGLSRVNHLLAIQVVSEAQPIWMQEVVNSYVNDPRLQELMTRLIVHSPDEQEFSLE
jgi:hypothetical protein